MIQSIEKQVQEDTDLLKGRTALIESLNTKIDLLNAKITTLEHFVPASTQPTTPSTQVSQE